MTKRFDQLNSVLSHLRQTSLKETLQGDLAESTGLETLGSMVDSESFKFAEKFYPNPSKFLPELFSNFPLLFCSKK